MVEFEQITLDFEILAEKPPKDKSGSSKPKVKSSKTKKAKDPKKKVKDEEKVDKVLIEEKIEEKVESKTLCNEEDTKETSVEVLKISDESQVDEVHNISQNLESHSKKEGLHLVDFQDTNIKKGSFISAVNDSIKIKNEREKEELANMNVDYPYKAVKLMTNAETQLFHFMENNLILSDRIRIIPKVRLADIIQVDERMSKNREAFYRIASKHIDFIIVDKYTFDLICAVELDDFYHDKDENKKKDELKFFSLLAAGINLFRIKCKIAEINKLHLRFIEEAILMYYRKPCPVCGADTRVKSKTSGNNIGHRFYSCTNFPHCRSTVDID